MKKLTETDHGTWETYLIHTDDGPMTILVNMNAHRYQAGRPLRCLVQIEIQKPTQYGFPTREEDEQLFTLEDALEVFMAKSCSGVYTGRTTHGGIRTFCYYLPADSAVSAAALNQAVSAVPGYEVALAVEDEKEWGYFHEFLCPGREELQCINNRKVLDNLMESGDDLEEPRETDHWIYFATQDARTAYRDEVVALGFTVRQESAKEDGRYGLQIFRVDRVDPDSIDTVTLTLLRLADEHDGDYDGWETFVVTAGEEPGAEATE